MSEPLAFKAQALAEQLRHSADERSRALTREWDRLTGSSVRDQQADALAEMAEILAALCFRVRL